MTSGWHRLHPLSPVVRSGRHVFALFVLVVLLVVSRGQGSDVVVDALFLGVFAAANVVSWGVTRWKVDGGALRIETGLLRRQSRSFPLAQLQAVDVVQTGVARVFGLAELRLRMAASGAGEGRLACLTVARAEALRRELLAAPAGPAGPFAGAPPAVPAAPFPGGAVATWAPAGRTLFEVDTSRLAAGILLTASGAGSLLVVGCLVGLAAGGVGRGFAGAAAAWAIGIALGVWRRFNGGYGTVVIDSPDGLRIESGMVQTTAETIRRGSVQAVRLVEPLAWRWLGWCRLEVDVAGPRQRKENRSEAGRLRAVMPVGTRADAGRLLAELVPYGPAPVHRPPAFARWKAPLRYRFLGWGGDARYVVASDGRVRRTTTWIPLAKVQSVRSVEGPWQRAMGLGTVLLDTAGRRVHAVLRDRSAAEVQALMATLPDLARSARAVSDRTTAPAMGRESGR